MKRYSDLEIIQGIRKQNEVVLKYLYDRYFNQVRAMVEQNNGMYKDAQEVFQDSIIIIYRKIKNENFELTSSFATYLYSVCWKIWMKELRDRNRENEVREEYQYLQENPEDVAVQYELHRRYKLYQEYFKKLNKECKKILKLYLKDTPEKKMAKKLGIENVENLKRRKQYCKKKLIELIKKDQRYNDRYEEL